MPSIKIDRLRIPPGVVAPPTVSLYYKPYYGDIYTLVASGIDIDAGGYVLDSPKPIMSLEGSERYLMRAVNEACGYEYLQSVILHPYCQVGYELSPDASECFYEEVVDATPPTFGENTIPKTYDSYSMCGSYIYEPGYNINGTGTSNIIPLPNLFWRNGDDPAACVPSLLYTGPLNRAGLWSATTTANQQIGFTKCIDIIESKTYYVAIGCDNYGIIISMALTSLPKDPAALDAQYGLAGNVATFAVWHIYPVLFLPEVITWR